MKCKNCSQPISQNFCPSCGQDAKVARLNFSTILSELTESVFQMNKGLLFTLKEMTVRPGHSVRDYINGRRVKHFKPIAYAFTLSTLYFLVSKFFDANTILNDAIEGVLLGATDAADGNLSSEFQGKLDVIKTNYALLMLVLIPVYALGSYIAFKGTGYNYLEHLVLTAFITGHQALLYTLFTILGVPISSHYLKDILSLLIPISYAFLVYWQFYSGQNRSTLIFPFVGSYLIYLILTVVVVVIPLILFAGSQ
jgi:hypothetical protein